MASVAVRSKLAVLLMLICVIFCSPMVCKGVVVVVSGVVAVVVCVCYLCFLFGFVFVLLYSTYCHFQSCNHIAEEKKEHVALLYLSSCCLAAVSCLFLFLGVLWVCFGVQLWYFRVITTTFGLKSKGTFSLQ